METHTNQMNSQQAGPTMQIKRSLIPIDEYAARQGISQDIVEEYAKLGVIQLRKCKGKTFVVDVPVGQHPYNTETHQATDESVQLTPQNNRSEGIPESIQEVSAEVLEIANELTAAVDESIRNKRQYDSMKEPDLKNIEIPDEQLQLDDKTMEVKEELKLPQPTHEQEAQLSPLTAQVKSKRIWQITTALLAVLLFAIFFVSVWVYMDRKIHIEKLEKANASIQTKDNNYNRATQQTEVLRNELDNSKAQIERVQNDRDNYKAQALTLQDELAGVTQRLKSIEARNAEAVERLNGQIQELSGQAP